MERLTDFLARWLLYPLERLHERWDARAEERFRRTDWEVSPWLMALTALAMLMFVVVVVLLG